EVAAAQVLGEVKLLYHLSLVRGDNERLTAAPPGDLNATFPFATERLGGPGQERFEGEHRSLCGLPGAGGILLGGQPSESSGPCPRFVGGLDFRQSCQRRGFDAPGSAGAVEGRLGTGRLLPPDKLAAGGRMSQRLQSGQVVTSVTAVRLHAQE